MTIEDMAVDLLVRSVISEPDEEKLAKMLYGEDRTQREDSRTKQAAVIWTVFNRIDDPRWGNYVDSIVTHTQFTGYKYSNPVQDWAVEIVRDVALRYALEKAGYENVGRVLPHNYFFFADDGMGGNRFRTEYSGDYVYWDWSLESPYDKDGECGWKN